MMWLDYGITSMPNGNWRVEQEAVDKKLYQEGDVFIVQNGWLIRQEQLTSLVVKHEAVKNEMQTR